MGYNKEQFCKVGLFPPAGGTPPQLREGNHFPVDAFSRSDILFGRSNFLAGATSWPEQLLGRSNFLAGATSWLEHFSAGATSWLEQLLGWSNFLAGATSWLEQLLGRGTSRPGRFSACTVGRPKDHTFASQSDTGHCCGLRRISDTAAPSAASQNPAVRSGANGHDPHKGTKGGG